MRAAIYTRVSQDHTGSERSVSEQEAECRALCERMGWPVVAVFPDNDRSASRYARKSRPKFEQLRAFIAGGGCDVVVYWEASRSSRDLAVFVPLRDLCRDLGVKLAYSGRVLDLNDPTDQFLAVLDAALGEQESARTSSRVKRALAANATAGRPHGPTIFGYRRNYHPMTRQLISVEVEESEAEMLREAARRLLAGESTYAVARWANDAGYRTLAGYDWGSDNLRRSLLNPSYAGKRTAGRRVVGDAVWPAILDEATWYRLQALLRDPGRDTARGRHAVTHLLSFIACCGQCGGPMRGLTSRGLYVCRDSGCVGRRIVSVDQLVSDVLLAGLDDPAVRPAFGPEADGHADVEAKAAREAAEAKRARLQMASDAYAEGKITVESLARIEQRLLGEIEHHEVLARRAALPAELRLYAEIDVKREWGSLPLTARRAIIRHLLTIEILPVGRGRRAFDPASVRVNWR